MLKKPLLRLVVLGWLLGGAAWCQSLNEQLDQAYDELNARTPTELTRQGVVNDRWDPLGPDEPRLRAELMESWAARLRAEDALNEEMKLSLRLYRDRARETREGLEFAEYDYPVNQMYGWHSEVPAFLANAQKVGSVSEAEAYLRRLERLPDFFQELGAALKRRQAAGILPPRFVFDYVLADIDNLLQGYPLTPTPDRPHPVFDDFRAKLAALKLPAQQQAALLARAETALRQGFAPAYQGLRQVLAEQRGEATEDDGVWKFPDGERFYNAQLRRVTTTDLSAAEIHRLGLQEVDRIHAEMRAILKQVQFQGTLPEFFELLRRDPRFFYSNDAAGRQAYLKDATAIVDRMRASLDRFFLTKPRAPLVVKAVEPYREASAGKAFYEAPALDGSRPGIYYANLYDMTMMPKYQMEALAYHEAIPGHHMQISIAQELPDLPKFRRLGGYTAYVEGWGLYCEQLPKEHGFYQDPYSDFGRLSLELFRAVRLVVDTGIHQQRWNRARALDYYLRNTPNSRLDCQKMVDRHIVMPAQATAYKVGMLEILRLREKARRELGPRFDLREFHDVLLRHGAVPLQVLDELVADYIRRKRGP